MIFINKNQMRIIITENQLKTIVENQKVLDQILDKISAEGIDSLTFREREYLDKYSKGKAPDDLGGDINYKKGTTIKSSLPQVADFTFVFQEVNETDENIEYYGIIYFGGNEYIGAFVCDKNNNLESIEFWIWGNDDQDPINLLDDAQGLEHELEVFFESDILPELVE